MDKFREAKRELSKIEETAIEEALAPLVEINGNGDEMVETIRSFLIAAFNNREEMGEAGAKRLATEIFDNASYAIISLAAPKERVKYSNDMKRFFEARHSLSPFLDEDGGYYQPVIEARAGQYFTALDRVARQPKKPVEQVLANWEILGREGRDNIICLMYGESIRDFIDMFAGASVEPGVDFEFALFFELGEAITKALAELERVDITNINVVSKIFIDKAREFFQGRYNTLVLRVINPDIH